MSRRIVLVVVAAIAVLAGVIGWMLGRQIESPAEAAARVAPPPASLISVPVESRELSSAVVSRGTIEFDQTTGIEIAGSETGSSIITRLTKEEGEDLVEGDVVVEVAGRPLFVLEGELPVFRSLTPGLDGPDVLQLEEALNRLELDPGPVDGVYDAQTEAAVDQLYTEAGYRPPAIDVSDQATLDGASDRVEEAEEALASARADAPQTGLAESVRLELDRSVSAVEQEAASLQAERTRALAELGQARTQANAAVDAANQALTVARERNEGARSSGIHPDTGVAPTPQELEELRAAQQEASLGLGAATAAATSAANELESQRASFDRQINDAGVSIRIAQAQRSEQIEQASNTGNQSQITSLTNQLADAREDLTSLQLEIGTRFPAAELVFLPSLPRLVQRINVDVGDIPNGSVMDVTGSELAVVSGVSDADRQLLEIGQVGTLDDPASGLSISAEIGFIADNPGGPDLSDDRYRIRLVPTSDVPEEVFNESLRLRIPISSTGGEVLTVPLAAVSAAADGSSRVERLVEDDETELVDVRVGLSSGGFVEVEALSGSLDVDDRVIVGRDQSSGDSSSEGDAEDASEVAGSADESEGG